MIHKVCYISSCWSVLSRNYLPYNIWYWLVTCTLRLNDVKEVICMLYFWLLWDDKNNVINQISISFSLWLWKPCLDLDIFQSVCLLTVCYLTSLLHSRGPVASKSMNFLIASVRVCLLIQIKSPSAVCSRNYHGTASPCWTLPASHRSSDIFTISSSRLTGAASLKEYIQCTLVSLLK